MKQAQSSLQSEQEKTKQAQTQAMELQESLAGAKAEIGREIANVRALELKVSHLERQVETKQ